MKFRHKGTILSAAALALTLGMAGTATAQTELRFASSQPAEGGYMGEFINTFGKALEEKTGGELSVKGFFSGALGSNERELAEMTQTGVVDLSHGATPYILGWAPSTRVFDLPYMFDDLAHYKAVVQGEVGDIIREEARDDGVEIIGFTIAGFRSIFNNERPLNSVADLEGLKIRSMESPVYVDMFTRLGMLPTPMPSSELFTALQLGTVDAGENDPASVMSWGWNDAIKYYSLDRHSIAVIAIMMNKAKFDSYSPEIQQAILDAAREAENYQLDYIAQAWEDSLEQIKASGVEVNEIADLDGFREAVAPVVEKYEAEIGNNLVQKVRDLGTQ